MGRHSEFTQKIADDICSALIEGRSLRSICSEDNMPGLTTVFRWLNEFESFRNQYARAREVQADVIADETFEITDDGRNDWMIIQRGDAEIEVANHENIQRSRLRFDQRRWWLSKVAPKKYGERVEVEQSGVVDVRVRIGGNAD